MTDTDTKALRELVKIANDWPANSKVWDAQQDIVDQAFGMIEEIDRLRAFAQSILVANDWDYDDWCRRARAALEGK
jgi:hypothetical protein